MTDTAGPPDGREPGAGMSAHIITIFDRGMCEEGPYLILELLHGETLASRLARGPLSPREAVRISLAVADALVHAHAAGVLHRDLKPSNVFLTVDAGVKVLDFGLAHVFGAGGPARSGTPGYMAPEQLRGERQDVRTDLFAVGVLLGEMLGARWARAAKPAVDLAARCRAEAPADRPPDAAALKRELRELKDALAPSARRAASVPQAEGRSRRAVQALNHFFRGEECHRKVVHFRGDATPLRVQRGVPARLRAPLTLARVRGPVTRRARGRGCRRGRRRARP